MTGVPQTRLDALYAGGDDPWKFRTSPYEQAKFDATRGALLRMSYHSALELGCGNGELARRLAPLCAHYTGLDAVDTALAAARKAVPGGCFVQGYLPCWLPGQDHDLIIVSEILYFLDAAGLASSAEQMSARWPRAEIITVNWLGPSGNALQGDEALGVFARSLARETKAVQVARNSHYRIDRFART